MSFKIFKFKILCRAENDLALPHFSGSTVRGAFGHALKSLACINLNEDCQSCKLSGECIYMKIFETSPSVPSGTGSSVKDIPHPFIIETDEGLSGTIPRGSSFKIYLAIFGQFENWSHYFFKAMQNAGKIGIGKGQGNFSLVEIKDYFSESVLFAGSYRPIRPSACSIDFKAKTYRKNIAIRLCSPLRIVKDGTLIDNLTPELLMTTVSRRLNLLNQFYGDQAKLYDFERLKRSCEKLRLEQSTVRLAKNRFSNRQAKYIPLDGLIGEIRLYNLNSLTYQIIKAAELVHIGKGSSLGLGQIKISNEK